MRFAVNFAFMSAIILSSAAFTDPLHDAVFLGDLKKVQELLKSDKTIINNRDENGATALMLAVNLGRTEIAEELLNFGAIPTGYPRGESLLMRAVSKAKMDLVNLLLNFAKKQDKLASVVNAKDDIGNPLLLHAANAFEPDIFNLLLNSGADPWATDNHGNTALKILLSGITLWQDQDREYGTTKMIRLKDLADQLIDLSIIGRKKLSDSELALLEKARFISRQEYDKRFLSYASGKAFSSSTEETKR